MGQQQLLLLVLSTVIVGLATVAGIQAFSENRRQATQDALVQRTTSIASDIAAASQEPEQLGGVDLDPSGNLSASDVSDAIGLSKATGISADGAGPVASCDIANSPTQAATGDGDVFVKCGSDGATGGNVQIEVAVDQSADNPVKNPEIKVTS
jgi:hypothetical protein